MAARRAILSASSDLACPISSSAVVALDKRGRSMRKEREEKKRAVSRVTKSQQKELEVCYMHHCGVSEIDRDNLKAEREGAASFVKELLGFWNKPLDLGSEAVQ